MTHFDSSTHISTPNFHFLTTCQSLHYLSSTSSLYVLNSIVRYVIGKCLTAFLIELHMYKPSTKSHQSQHGKVNFPCAFYISIKSSKRPTPPNSLANNEKQHWIAKLIRSSVRWSLIKRVVKNHLLRARSNFSWGLQMQNFGTGTLDLLIGFQIVLWLIIKWPHP